MARSLALTRRGLRLVQSSPTRPPVVVPPPDTTQALLVTDQFEAIATNLGELIVVENS